MAKLEALKFWLKVFGSHLNQNAQFVWSVLIFFMGDVL